MSDSLSYYDNGNWKAEDKITRETHAQKVSILPMSRIISLHGTFTSEHLREIADILDERVQAARELEERI